MLLPDDSARFQHILEAANVAMRSLERHQRADLESNHVWTLGLIKCVEIIGEAAARLSPEARASLPAIPWKRVIAMRNRLVHAYFDIDLDQVWRAVKEDLPPLAMAIEKHLEIPKLQRPLNDQED